MTDETTLIDAPAADLTEGVGAADQQVAQEPTAEPTEAQAPAVPEAYEFAMPEGIELDSVAAEQFGAVAKEMGLTQEQASKVADVAAGMMQRQQDAHRELVTSWTEQSKADKEFGGDKLDTNLATAKRAMESFGSPELRDVLNSTGLGNHPAIIRAFYRIGNALAEDRFIASNTQATRPADTAKLLFPTMN